MRIGDGFAAGVFHCAGAAMRRGVQFVFRGVLAWASRLPGLWSLGDQFFLNHGPRRAAQC